MTGHEWIDLTPAHVDAFVPLFVDAFGAPPWNALDLVSLRKRFR